MYKGSENWTDPGPSTTRWFNLQEAFRSNAGGLILTNTNPTQFDGWAGPTFFGCWVKEWMSVGGRSEDTGLGWSLHIWLLLRQSPLQASPALAQFKVVKFVNKKKFYTARGILHCSLGRYIEGVIGFTCTRRVSARISLSEVSRSDNLCVCVCVWSVQIVL